MIEQSLSPEAETGLDPETEAPPSLGIFTATEAPGTAAEAMGRGSLPAGGPAVDYDQWGNIKAAPIKIIEENHGENFIKIFIYKTAAGPEPMTESFFFGFQLKIDKVVRQKRANISDPHHRGPDSARAAARDMIIDICKKNHGIKRLFADFTVIRYNQPELF